MLVNYYYQLHFPPLPPLFSLRVYIYENYELCVQKGVKLPRISYNPKNDMKLRIIRVNCTKISAARIFDCWKWKLLFYFMRHCSTSIILNRVAFGREKFTFNFYFRLFLLFFYQRNSYQHFATRYVGGGVKRQR